MPKFLDLIKGEGPAVQLIKSLVSSTLESTEILSKVREAGMVINTNTGNAVVNYLRNVNIPGQNALRDLDINLIPSISSIPKSLTTLLSNFSYKVAVTGQDPFTQESRKQYIQIRSNQVLTKQQAMDYAANVIESGSGNYGIAFESADVEEIIQNNAGITDSGIQLINPQLAGNSIFDAGLGKGDTVIPFGYASLADYYRDIQG